MFPFIWYLWGLYFSFSGWTNTCILWLSSFFSQNSFRLSWIYFSSFWKFIFQLYRPKNIEIDTLCKRSPWPRQLWAPAEQTEIFQWKWDRRSDFSYGRCFAYFRLLISKGAKNVGTDNHFHEIWGGEVYTRVGCKNKLFPIKHVQAVSKSSHKCEKYRIKYFCI